MENRAANSGLPALSVIPPIGLVDVIVGKSGGITLHIKPPPVVTAASPSATATPIAKMPMSTAQAILHSTETKLWRILKLSAPLHDTNFEAAAIAVLTFDALLALRLAIDHAKMVMPFAETLASTPSLTASLDGDLQLLRDSIPCSSKTPRRSVCFSRKKPHTQAQLHLGMVVNHLKSWRDMAVCALVVPTVDGDVPVTHDVHVLIGTDKQRPSSPTAALRSALHIHGNHMNGHSGSGVADTKQTDTLLRKRVLAELRGRLLREGLDGIFQLESTCPRSVKDGSPDLIALAAQLEDSKRSKLMIRKDRSRGNSNRRGTAIAAGRGAAANVSGGAVVLQNPLHAAALHKVQSATSLLLPSSTSYPFTLVKWDALRDLQPVVADDGARSGPPAKSAASATTAARAVAAAMQAAVPAAGTGLPIVRSNSAPAAVAGVVWPTVGASTTTVAWESEVSTYLGSWNGGNVCVVGVSLPADPGVTADASTSVTGAPATPTPDAPSSVTELLQNMSIVSKLLQSVDRHAGLAPHQSPVAIAIPDEVHGGRLAVGIIYALGSPASATVVDAQPAPSVTDLATFSSSPHLTLGDRMQLVLHVGASIRDLHAAGIVHGSLCPSTVLVRTAPARSGSAASFQAVIVGAAVRNLAGDVEARASSSGSGPAAGDDAGISSSEHATFESDAHAFGMVAAMILTGSLPSAASFQRQRQQAFLPNGARERKPEPQFLPGLGAALPRLWIDALTTCCSSTSGIVDMPSMWKVMMALLKPLEHLLDAASIISGALKLSDALPFLQDTASSSSASSSSAVEVNQGPVAAPPSPSGCCSSKRWVIPSASLHDVVMTQPGDVCTASWMQGNASGGSTAVPVALVTDVHPDPSTDAPTRHAHAAQWEHCTWLWGAVPDHPCIAKVYGTAELSVKSDAGRSTVAAAPGDVNAATSDAHTSYTHGRCRARVMEHATDGPLAALLPWRQRADHVVNLGSLATSDAVDATMPSASTYTAAVPTTLSGNLSLLLGVSEALSHLHEHGVVHGCPSVHHVLLAADGSPKLTLCRYSVKLGRPVPAVTGAAHGHPCHQHVPDPLIKSAAAQTSPSASVPIIATQRTDAHDWAMIALELLSSGRAAVTSDTGVTSGEVDNRTIVDCDVTQLPMVLDAVCSAEGMAMEEGAASIAARAHLWVTSLRDLLQSCTGPVDARPSMAKIATILRSILSSVQEQEYVRAMLSVAQDHVASIASAAAQIAMSKAAYVSEGSVNECGATGTASYPDAREQQTHNASMPATQSSQPPVRGNHPTAVGGVGGFKPARTRLGTELPRVGLSRSGSSTGKTSHSNVSNAQSHQSNGPSAAPAGSLIRAASGAWLVRQPAASVFHESSEWLAQGQDMEQALMPSVHLHHHHGAGAQPCHPGEDQHENDRLDEYDSAGAILFPPDPTDAYHNHADNQRFAPVVGGGAGMLLHDAAAVFASPPPDAMAQAFYAPITTSSAASSSASSARNNSHNRRRSTGDAASSHNVAASRVLPGSEQQQQADAVHNAAYFKSSLREPIVASWPRHDTGSVMRRTAAGAGVSSASDSDAGLSVEQAASTCSISTSYKLRHSRAAATAAPGSRSQATAATANAAASTHASAPPTPTGSRSYISGHLSSSASSAAGTVNGAKGTFSGLANPLRIAQMSASPAAAPATQQFATSTNAASYAWSGSSSGANSAATTCTVTSNGPRTHATAPVVSAMMRLALIARQQQQDNQQSQ